MRFEETKLYGAWLIEADASARPTRVLRPDFLRPGNMGSDGLTTRFVQNSTSLFECAGDLAWHAFPACAARRSEGGQLP